MSQLWAELRTHSRAKSCFRNMHIGMFCKAASPNAKFPKLKGRAAEIKALGAPLLAAWTAHMDETNVVHRQVKLMMQCSVKLDQMIDEHRNLNCYPEPVFREFLSTCESYLVLYSAPASHYMDIGNKIFNVVPKHHILWHVCWMAQFLNPRWAWCFSGEDFMLHARRLGSASLRGTPTWHISRKVIHRWIRGFTWRITGLQSRDHIAGAS